MLFACCAAAVSADDSVSVAVKNIVQNDVLTHHIYVTGRFDAGNDNVMLIVRGSGSEITVLEQGTTDADGNISFDFMCNNADTYTGQLNSETANIRLPFSFPVLSQQEYDGIVEEFNSANEENISGVIAKNAGALSLDMTQYTEEMKAEIDRNMLAECGGLTILTINESFDKSVLYAYLFGDAATEDKNRVLDYYGGLHYSIAVQENAANIYKSFRAFDVQTQEKVYRRLAENKPAELSDFAAAFNEAVVLTAASELENADFDEFLIRNGDLVKLEGYSGLTPVLRNTYINAMKRSGAESIAELVAAYKKATEDKKDSGSGGSSSSGGGGGGSTGKVIGVPAVPSDTDKPDEISTVRGGFDDLAGYDWAADAIGTLNARGIVSGKEEGKFFPGDDITRAEFVSIIVRAFGLFDETAECSFTDVASEHWSYRYIASGFNSGIISGIGADMFGGSEKITREQMAAILYRAIRNSSVIKRLDVINNNLRDFDAVSGYAQNSVLVLSNLGIINGYGDGSFAPQKNATRAEVSVMINNTLGVIADD